MNFDSIRRMVSGKKSRLADAELGVDLDLSYITDKIIMQVPPRCLARIPRADSRGSCSMGYPASGLESLYRNRR